MKVFVPLIFFAVSEDDKEICDGVMQCFHSLDDLQMLYPDTKYLEVSVSEFNVHDN